MQNNLSKRRNTNIIKFLFKIIFLIIVILIVMVFSLIKIRENRNKAYIKNYPMEIAKYLENKYEKKFHINPKYKTTGSSPIPGNTYSPYIFEISELDKEGIVFNVRIYPKTKNSNKIKEIQDNYCWKFLNIKTKEWFQKNLVSIITEDYKFIMRSMYSNSYYDNDDKITPDLPLEDFYKNSTFPISLKLQIVLSPNKQLQNSDQLERAIENVAKNFQQIYPNSRIRLNILRATTQIDYESIDIRELENVPFFLHKEWVNIGDIANLETIKNIKLEKEN